MIVVRKTCVFNNIQVPRSKVKDTANVTRYTKHCDNLFLFSWSLHPVRADSTDWRTFGFKFTGLSTVNMILCVGLFLFVVKTRFNKINLVCKQLLHKPSLMGLSLYMAFCNFFCIYSSLFLKQTDYKASFSVPISLGYKEVVIAVLLALGSQKHLDIFT